MDTKVSSEQNYIDVLHFEILTIQLSTEQEKNSLFLNYGSRHVNLTCQSVTVNKKSLKRNTY